MAAKRRRKVMLGRNSGPSNLMCGLVSRGVPVLVLSVAGWSGWGGVNEYLTLLGHQKSNYCFHQTCFSVPQFDIIHSCKQGCLYLVRQYLTLLDWNQNGKRNREW